MITTKISADFALPNMNAPVEAMQGDGATRTVAVTLRANGRRFEPPAGVDAALAYRQPDGHKGIYDKLADESPAITISGNVASVVLIPQILTVAGDVQCQLIFNDSKMDRLTSFPFVLRVAKSHIEGAVPVQDYVRLQWLEDKLAEYWNPARVQIGTAVARAEEAVAGANQALEEAGTAIELASEAARTANQAADIADTAARSANEAAGDAQEQAAAAENAASAANASAERAQTAASDVDIAKENADTAAQEAATAAAAAQESAAAAENAANAANAAANRADTAAAGADTAKENADTAAEAANTAAAAAQAVVDGIVPEVNQLKCDISNLRFGDPYDGVDLSVKFADEIAAYSDTGAWLKARIKAANFDGIHVNDFIPFTTTNGLNFKARVAGIDPYYEYGDSAVGHHIDFICEELWPTLKPINPVNYNNGLIPTENVTSDGTATQYVLTKPMYGVAKVTLSGADLTGWIYDKDTDTLTFSTAPAAGTMVVTGTGSEYPWFSCDAYLYANSLAGHVANGTGLNPAIKRVDYTNDGIYHYLPDWLKAVIIDKRFLLNRRYYTSGVLSDDEGWGWVNLGKLWFPTEVEVCGCPVWGNKSGYGLGGSSQYPIFMGNMRRVKKRNGSRRHWWLLSPYTGAKDWCLINDYGNASYYFASHTTIASPVCFRVG